jgi:hypothetical protein
MTDISKLQQWIYNNSILTTIYFGGLSGISILIAATKSNEEEFHSKIVDQVLNTIGSCGVIGALIFSGLFSFITSILNPSQSSINFFSNNTISIFTNIYYFFIYTALATSAFTVLQSFFHFVAISMWMPTKQLQFWYIKRISILPMLVMSIASVTTTIISFIFGIAVNVSPIAALFALLITISFVIGGSISYFTLFDICYIKLFEETRIIIDKDIEKGI